MKQIPGHLVVEAEPKRAETFAEFAGETYNRCREHVRAQQSNYPPVFGETTMQEQMQLKVCEGCGGLWVRPLVLRGVYCDRCYGRLKAFPKAAELRGARPGLRKARPELSTELIAAKAQHTVTLRTLHAVAAAGGAR